MTKHFHPSPPAGHLKPRGLCGAMIDGTIVHSPAAESPDGDSTKDRCPECAGRLIHRDGCMACAACGYSTCG